jgi:hypothetical protein
MNHNKLEEGTIKCPHCDQLIPINSTLHQQLSEILKEEMEKDYDKRLTAEKQKWQSEAREKAEDAVSLELKDLREQVAENKKTIGQSNEKELALLKKTRELEEREKNIELNTERRVAEEKRIVEEQTTKRVAGEYEGQLMETRKQLDDARKQAAELKRKTEQGSQQMQGEVSELKLEESLRALFPFDEILPVPKGINGADVLQKVRDGFGRECGGIIWESKQTKAWSQGWIQKLKEDQRQVKAEMAIIVSKMLPGEIKTFGDIEGIYVTNFESIFGVASVLRLQLIQIAATKRSLIGKNEKMEVIWNYLHGTAFKQRVEAIIEAFSAMNTNLDKEKNALTRMWAERKKQIEQVITNTSGMCGDLQGLTGGSMPTIQSLELPLLDTGGEEA